MASPASLRHLARGRARRGQRESLGLARVAPDAGARQAEEAHIRRCQGALRLDTEAVFTGWSSPVRSRGTGRGAGDGATMHGLGRVARDRSIPSCRKRAAPRSNRPVLASGLEVTPLQRPHGHPRLQLQGNRYGSSGGIAVLRLGNRGYTPTALAMRDNERPLRASSERRFMQGPGCLRAVGMFWAGMVQVSTLPQGSCESRA